MQHASVADRAYRQWFLCVLGASAVIGAMLLASGCLLRSPVAEEGPQVYLEYAPAYRRAIRERKPLALFFTGVNNVNARAVEVNTFVEPEIKPLLRRYVFVWLYTDCVPSDRLTRKESEKRAEAHHRWMWSLFGGFHASPGLVLFEPDPRQMFETDGTPKGKNLGERVGMIELMDIPEVARFLNGPFERK